MVGPEPAVEYLLHENLTLVEQQHARLFVAAMAGVAFNVEHVLILP